MSPVQIQIPSRVHKSHKSLRYLELTGLLLFFAGMALLVGSLGLSDYRLTESALTSLASQNRIPTERLQLVHPMLDRHFASKIDFLREVGRLLRQDTTMNAYELGVARFWLLKRAVTGVLRERTLLFFWLSLGLATLGSLLYILPQIREGLPGIKNNNIWRHPVMARGLPGIMLGVLLIVFYILLYWYPEYIVNMIILVDPISEWLRRQPADQWFFYGFLYTLTIAVMGTRMFIKYRHSRYHIVRTASVIFFQFGFAFMIPSLLERIGKPAMDLKNAWPLNYTFFMDWNMRALIESGQFGWFLLVWGVLLSLVAVPVMTYFFGKRWYCSWVCGCGGLAETLGDPFRQLSNKSLRAWRVERLMIHSVLVVAVIMTVMQIANFVSDGNLFRNYTWRVNQWYGFFIGAIFAGVVGTGFYPLMGNRVWCRFGCPLAAILGIVQKYKSRFRITTNGGQCISCGNCSTYCEMGIDVRWYAQRGQNIIRASCVGCGVCAAVCPRGVLALENGPEKGRYMPIEEMAA